MNFLYVFPLHIGISNIPEMGLRKIICSRNKMAKIQITYSNAPHHFTRRNIQNGNFSVILARKKYILLLNLL